MPLFVFILIIVLSVILILGIIFSFVFTFPIAKKIFFKQWIRNDKNMFLRECSDKSVDYHLDMFNKGLKIRDEHKKFIKNVSVISDGIKLVGEYYDFGFDKCVIILPGRTETCFYSAYYLPAFKNAGCNVLCIDPRSHGESEGDILTLGYLEEKDTIKWADLLHNEYNIQNIYIYGLCGGSTTGCILFNDKECPSYINAFIADGMFFSFVRVYKRHIKEEKKPLYPFTWEIMYMIKKYCHVNPYKAKPSKLIKGVHVPILILSGTKDQYVLTKESKKMYENCPSKNKQFGVIENGRHSHLRYDNCLSFDQSIKSFIEKL